MIIRAMRFSGWITGVAAAALFAMPGIAAAQHGFGGGGGHSGGARFSGGARIGGGAHFGGGGRFGGGARFSGGTRFAGGGGHFGGLSREPIGGFSGGRPAARFSEPRAAIVPHSGARFSSSPRISPRVSGGIASTPRFGSNPRYAASAPRLAAPARALGAETNTPRLAASSGWNGRASGWSGHASGWNGHASGWNGGAARSWYGPRWGSHPYWRGGWWRGSYWPRAFYGWSFPWFLPVLPVGCATFWWSGIPYYYVNSVYYVWNPTDNGYVVTNPPPIGDSEATDADDSAVDEGSAAQATSASAADDVYMYPENGQSPDQQANDRYQCHKWAQDQTGFDPTQPNGGSASASPEDYRRAMIACLDARGYSAK